EQQTAEVLASRFVRLLEQAIEAPDAAISTFDLLTPEERHSLLVDANATARPLANTTIDALFQRQPTHTPAAAAIAFGATTLSYGELNAAANHLAHHLRCLGIGPGDLVAVRLDRDPALIISLLAILKAGAVYVPLDLAYPQQRVEHMLADCRA